MGLGNPALQEALASGCPASSLPCPSGGHALQEVLDFRRPKDSGGFRIQEAIGFRRPCTSGGPWLLPEDPKASILKPQSLLIGLLTVKVPENVRIVQANFAALLLCRSCYFSAVK
jgi:hypothetical protein